MKFTVIWSEFAETQLDEIFEYYATNISENTAQKIAISILNQTEKLSESPFIGQEEELLLNRKQSYRYLIYTNYKIIYTVDLSNNFVKISDIFDSRQNPIKIKRNIL